MGNNNTPKNTHMKHYGITLFGRGYRVIPLVPREKRPAISNWTQVVADPEKIRKWSRVPEAGIGVVTGNVVGIDLDIDDDIVDNIIAHCQMMYGDFPVRRGYGKRVVMVFRARGSREKQRGKKFKNPKDKKRPHQVEALGRGQQFVAYGIHPDTGKEYEWLGKPLHEWDVDDLPELDIKDVHQVIEYADGVLEKAGFKAIGDRSPAVVDGGVDGETGGETGGTDLMAGIKDRLDVSMDRIEMVLDSLGDEYLNDYNRWLQVGMALHHQFNGSEEGRRLWDKWSQRSVFYDAQEIIEKWETFNVTRAGHDVVTLATLMHHSGVRLFGKDPLADALKHYIYLAKGDLVADLRHLPHRATHPLTVFKNLLANNRVNVPPPNGEGKPKSVSVATLWLTDKMRKTATQSLYLPGAPRVFEREGQITYNTFSFPRHEETEATDKMGVLLDHFRFVFPVKAEYEWIVGYMAHVVQRPWERSQVSPLNVAPAHGTGRGTAVMILEELYGPWNCQKVSLDDFMEGKFNGYLSGSLMVFIDETHESGAKKYAVNDRIRDKLTERRLMIEHKFGAKGTEDVYARMFLMSNRRDATQLPAEDRRINVFQGPEAPRSEKYYQGVRDALNRPESIAQLFRYLERYDLSGWSMSRSIHTAGRADMIEFGRSETEELFYRLLDDPPQEVMTYRQVCKALRDMEKADIAAAGGDVFDGGSDVSDTQVVKLLQKECRRYPQLRINGRPQKTWVIKPGTKLTNEKVRQIMERRPDEQSF